MNVDGMTTTDDASWISFHFYVVKAWKEIPLLVQCVGTIDNVIELMF